MRDAAFEPIAIPADTLESGGKLCYNIFFANTAYGFELPDNLRDRVMGEAIIAKLTERVKALYSPPELD